MGSMSELVDKRGQLTRDGLRRIVRIIATLRSVLDGRHDDNTYLICREDLNGHDSCYTCNAVQDILHITAKYYE